VARKSITKVANQKAAKRPKCFSFFFFLLSSDGLAQYCVNLSRWFTHETAAFYTEQRTTPSLFHNFEVSQGTRSHSLKNYGFQIGTPFSLFVLRMRILRSLSNDTKLLLKIAELEIKSICHAPEHGIEEAEHALCCQLNQAIGKTEVGPSHKYEYI